MKVSGSTLSDKGFARELLDQLKLGNRVALCSVLSTRGSMPRPADARMALFEDGRLMGTVGGGRIEYLGQQRCAELLRIALGESQTQRAVSSLEWYTRAETGMMCGGDALLAVRVLGKADLEVLEAIVGCSEPGFELEEDWSDSSFPSWRVRKAQADRCGCASSWDDERRIYVEPLAIAPVVYLYGAGHVALALAPVLSSLGLQIAVFDEREQMVSAGRFPDADRLSVCQFEALGPDELPSPHDYAIIMTPSHKSDYTVLAKVMQNQPAYVGCIGSVAKTARFRTWLAGEGFAQSEIDSIHMPIGDPIGAVTPAEIAISIAAEVVRFRSTKR